MKLILIYDDYDDDFDGDGGDNDDEIMQSLNDDSDLPSLGLLQYR